MGFINPSQKASSSSLSDDLAFSYYQGMNFLLKSLVFDQI